MAAPKSVIWQAEPHTLAKHAILRSYLHAWFPILTSGYGRAVYYDGFAGPGRYQGGEEGSPLIAMEAARVHVPKMRGQIDFIFVEQDAERASHLELVELAQLQMPAQLRWRVLNETFESALEHFLSAGERQAPTFAFVDPFGIDGVPFGLIARLLQQQQCEVLVTFMKSTVNRFVTELGPNVNRLIGNPQASDIIATASNRLLSARQLYAGALSGVAKFVRYFEMRNAQDVPIYDLFFATNHELGHRKMKEAMWKTDAEGTFGFSDGIDPSQMVLLRAAHGRVLAGQLLTKFGQTVHAWTPVGMIKEYVDRDTVYLERHATEALRLLEDQAVASDWTLEIAPEKETGEKRRPHTFPSGTMVRFRRRP